MWITKVWLELIIILILSLSRTILGRSACKESYFQDLVRPLRMRDGGRAWREALAVDPPWSTNRTARTLKKHGGGGPPLPLSHCKPVVNSVGLWALSRGCQVRGVDWLFGWPVGWFLFPFSFFLGEQSFHVFEPPPGPFLLSAYSSFLSALLTKTRD